MLKRDNEYKTGYILKDQITTVSPYLKRLTEHWWNPNIGDPVFPTSKHCFYSEMDREKVSLKLPYTL